MNLPSGSSRRQEAHSIPNASSGKKIRASLPRLLRKIGLGSWPQCASKKLEVEATHEPDPHPACGHPLPSDGRGAGGEGSFSVEVHGPNARARDVHVKATHEPSPP